MQRNLSCTALLALCALSALAHADIFSYVDAQGVMHFSNRPDDARFKLYMKGSRPQRDPNVIPVAPSDRSPERFSRYDPFIREAATLYQIPEELVRAVIKVESDYDPRAVSTASAQGLMQLIPPTALRMQVRDSFDPRENILGGTRYLRILANLFDGNLELTVAAYNAGEGAVSRFGGVPPYPETQDYVVKVLTYYRRYRTLSDTAIASQASSR